MMACGKEEVLSVISIDESTKESDGSETRESLSAVSTVRTVLGAGGVVTAGYLVVVEVHFFDVFDAGHCGHECKS